nr:retrovirus-related Pol polyprotein from transposon TNT 1-94 [Tanacetum cinerariifolium]
MHSAQAKYVGASEATIEAVWIRKFVRDLGVMPSINKHINMYCDNSAAIIFANEPGIMKGARHFLQRYHYVREQVETGTTIAMHSAQAEYVAALEAAMEVVWIRKFVRDLGVMPLINKPINMYCDNSTAIIFANEPGIIKGARDFLRRYHYIQEQVETSEIKLIKVHTDDNLADPFTKGFA